MNRQHCVSILHVIAILLSICPVDAAEDPTLKKVGAIPPEVIAVQTGGEWSTDLVGGYYRIVITSYGFEHVHNEAYIQWIADNEGKVSVISTAHFDSPMYSFNIGEWGKTQSGTTEFLISAVHTYAITNETIRFKLGKPGKFTYDISPVEHAQPGNATDAATSGPHR